jgi:two-component system phosphate regulon sensor histidine kinase PhoR
MDNGWDSWRRGLWLAAAAVVLGAVIALTSNVGIWICLALAATAAGAALLAGSRARAAAGLPPVVTIGSDIAVSSPMMRSVFEQVPDAIMLLDRNGRALFANRAMRQVIGTTEVERKHVSALLRIPAVLEAVEKATRTGKPESLEFSFRVPVEQFYEAYIARADMGSSVTVVVLHDLTAAKKAEQMRADFVANASHELRTPLAAVSGFIDTLRGHARDDAEAREKFLGIMSVEAGRMRRLIDDLLSLTRIELNEHVRPSNIIGLEDVVRDAASALSPLAEIDGMDIEIAHAEDLPPVRGDRDELIQLFQNLIHNAIKYGKEKGKVVVSFGKTPSPGGRNADDFVFASVKDDGEGISADAIPRLTERFYRVDVKRSRERGGTGLGLAIVKHILNRHRGRLQIESQAGEGSTFTVFLPVASDTAATSVI